MPANPLAVPLSPSQRGPPTDQCRAWAPRILAPRQASGSSLFSIHQIQPKEVSWGDLTLASCGSCLWFSELDLSPGQHQSAPYCFPQMLMRYLCFLDLLWWRKEKQWMRLLRISFFTIKYHKWDSLYLWFQPRKLKHIMDNSFFVKLKV